MPFLPFVLLLAWQALSRGASFALGWATALYFGQVPGRQGRMLAVVSLVAAAWVILIVGFALPILIGAALESAGVIGQNFDVETIHYVGLVAGIVLIPPIAAAITVWGEIHTERSVDTWLKLVPVSYPSTFMLGAGVLMMCVFTPIALFRRWRHGVKYLQISLVMREGTDDDDLVDGIRDALTSIGIEDVDVAAATGPKTWPLRTVGFAADHLLGAVVRGEPMHLEGGGIEIFAYATTISVQGPKEEAYRVRAAIERKLGFHDAYLTWNDEAQQIEDSLLEAHQQADGDAEALGPRLDEIQERMDTASLNDEEWNVLYRRRLQIELQAHVDDDGAGRNGSDRREAQRARSA